MNVEDVMTRDPRTVVADTDLDRAIELMDEHALRHLPVVRGEELVGIVSNRDLLEATGWVRAGAHTQPDPERDARTIEHVMKTKVISVHPEETVVSASLILVLEKIGSLPVVDGGRLVGILTERDLLSAWLKTCQNETVPGETDTPIRRLITRDLFTLSTKATLGEAVTLCRSERINHLPVAEGGKLIGFLSDRDLKRALGQHRPDDTPITELLGTEIYTLTEEMSLYEAARLMYDHHISGIPITSGTSEAPGTDLVGLITLSDVLAYCMESLREPDRPARP